MSLGKVLMGVASLMLGARHIQSGFAELKGSSGTNGLGKATPPPRQRKGPTTTVYEIRTLDERISFIQKLIRNGKLHPAVVEFARRAVTEKCGKDWCIPEKDNIKEAAAIFDATRRHVRYVSDPLGVDLYEKPQYALKFRGTDCDGYTILLGSLLLSIGIPCKLKVIRTKDSNEWNHIYVVAGFPRSNPTKWIAMDASVPKPFGWEAPAEMVAAARFFAPE